jgi:TnpA family transposase
VTRGQQLAEAQIAALFAPSMDQRELVHHYTLSEADIAMIRRCRGDSSRLGCALMLCYLRYPGCALHANERPPAAVIAFVAEQIDVAPEAIDNYLASEQNRWRRAAELQDRLRLRPFGTRLAAYLIWRAVAAVRN